MELKKIQLFLLLVFFLHNVYSQHYYVDENKNLIDSITYYNKCKTNFILKCNLFKKDSIHFNIISHAKPLGRKEF